MNDIFGNVLTVGDEVAFLYPQYKSVYFIRGKIVGFTPQMAKLEYTYQGSAGTTLKSPHLIAKNNKIS